MRISDWSSDVCSSDLRPLPVQYLDWAGKALSGDLGRSVYFRVPVADLIAERLPVTMLLGALALAFAIALSIPLGVVAALRPNSLLDRVCLWIAVDRQSTRLNSSH